MIFRGPNTKMTSLSWHDDDTGFWTSDYTGSIYEWKLKQGNLGWIHFQKGVWFSSIVRVN